MEDQQKAERIQELRAELKELTGGQYKTVKADQLEMIVQQRKEAIRDIRSLGEAFKTIGDLFPKVDPDSGESSAPGMMTLAPKIAKILKQLKTDPELKTLFKSIPGILRKYVQPEQEQAAIEQNSTANDKKEAETESGS